LGNIKVIEKFRKGKNMKKVTVSVGIPAYNEEASIASIIKSILLQEQESYTLENIFVIADGCTDKTVEIVKKLTVKNKEIKLIARKDRSGKVTGLNTIYKANESDFVLTIDADLVFAKNDDIENLVKVITSDNNINVVGPRHVPVKAKTIMGKFAYVSFASFEDAFLKINNGNNFYAVMSAYLLRKNFSKSIKYPQYAQADQVILYAMATRKSKYSRLGRKGGFRFVPSAQVLFRTVSTFEDWRILGIRSVLSDKMNVSEYFGDKILNEYSMPRHLFAFSLVKWFLKSPFYTLGSVLMNIFIRKFPLRSKMPKKGIWETAMSSKEAISI
jgi:glycosyltransferase involved in cell wall biosynthesis